MTPDDVPWVALGFVCGLVCGELLREAFRLVRGRETEMRRLRVWLRRNNVAVAVVALLVVSLFNGTVGLVIMAANGDRAELIQCFSEYNQKVGQARDERAAASARTVEAEITYVESDVRYQQGLLQSLDGGGDPDRLREVVRSRLSDNRGYLSNLKDGRKVVLENEYPSPTYCEGR